MIMTGKIQTILRKFCPNVPLSTMNPMWIGMGLKMSLHSDRPATNCLRHGRDLQITRFLTLQ